MPAASVTVDLDTSAHYRAIHGLPAPAPGEVDPMYRVGVARLLDFLEERAIPATLFVIGQDVDAHPAHRVLLEQAVAAGHELGSHTFYHRYDLRRRAPAEVVEDVALGEEAIAALTGARPVGFRTPGYNLDGDLFEVLARRGYLYDSSVFPCPLYYAAKGAVMAWLRLRGRPSRSAMTRPGMQLAPITPYRPSPRDVWRPGGDASRPLEIPMCVVPGARLPVIGTSLQAMGAAGFAAIYPALRRTHRRLLQLEFHAIDFMDANDEGVAALAGVQPDLRVPWPTKRERYHRILDRVARDYDFATLAEVARRW